MNDNYTIHINAMRELNNTIGKRLECVDAERAKKLRQKKQRRDKRKNSFRAAKHRYASLLTAANARQRTRWRNTPIIPFRMSVSTATIIPTKG